MNKYKILSNDGHILDIYYGLDLVDAIDFANRNDLPTMNIVDIGPVRLENWAMVTAA